MTSNKPNFIFKSSSKSDVFNFLYTSPDIKTWMEDFWCVANGQEWDNQRIVDCIKSVFNFNIDINASNFSIIRDFFNQYMMFEIVGYKNQEDFDKANGDFINHEPYSYLKDLQEEIDLFPNLFSDYNIIKIRSNNGEYSSLAKTFQDIKQLTPYL